MPDKKPDSAELKAKKKRMAEKHKKINKDRPKGGKYFWDEEETT